MTVQAMHNVAIAVSFGSFWLLSYTLYTHTCFPRLECGSSRSSYIFCNTSCC